MDWLGGGERVQSEGEGRRVVVRGHEDGLWHGPGCLAGGREHAMGECCSVSNLRSMLISCSLR